MSEQSRSQEFAMAATASAYQAKIMSNDQAIQHLADAVGYLGYAIAHQK